MLLNLGLWMVANDNGRYWLPVVKYKLNKAARWYCDITDNGRYPRPVFGSHDSSRVLYPFYGKRDEGSFIQELITVFENSEQGSVKLAGLIPIQDDVSRGYLRVAKFNGRPSHADQLHFDLWMNDDNILIDPGTFSYNNPPPWDNSLSSTFVHNTVMIDGNDQMTRAGRFLWLDWAQGRIINVIRSHEGAIEQVRASHDGYLRLGINHVREIHHRNSGHWTISDQLMLTKAGRHRYRLQWNLPAWDWQMNGNKLIIQKKSTIVHMDLMAYGIPEISIVHGGKTVLGTHIAKEWEGWCSWEYGQKEECLLLLVEGEFDEDIRLITDISLNI